MRKLISLVLLALFVCFLISCEKEEPEAVEVLGDEAKLISHKTMGVIPPDGAIAVRFNKEMITKNQVGVPLKKEVFSFSPKIEGTSIWENTRTLVFKPTRPLKMRQSYEGSLDIRALFPNLPDIKPDKIALAFESPGREIALFTADFKLVKDTDPTRLVFEGRIGFTLDTDILRVKKGIELYEDDKRLKLEVEKTDSANVFAFRSPVFIRGNKTRYLTVKIDETELELSGSKEYSYTLPPLTVFDVSWVEEEVSGKDLFIRIGFSDQLDLRKDYRGFVKTEPAVDIELKVTEKVLVVRGDFQFGETYRVFVLEGMRSKWGTVLSESSEHEIEFPAMKPQIAFTHSGVFLPSANKKRIGFRTVNVRRVIATVKKVYENNLGFFVQENNLTGAKEKRDEYWSWNRVGVIAAVETLEIGNTENKWLQSELDLGELITSFDKGLYIIELKFGMEDILTGLPDDWSRWEYSDYIYSHGSIVKPIILTDVGLTAKKTADGILVYATNLLTTRPIAGVTVKLRSYQNQVLETGRTDNAGKCVFDSTNAFYIEAEYRGHRSVLLFKNTELNSSLFDIGGATDVVSETRAFIYTDRGVYRPGDTINLSVIARNKTGTFPADHPVTLKLYNPQNRVTLETTQRKAVDGFYTFTFKTDDNALTGNWKAVLSIGDKDFTRTIKIETIVPYRIKVLLTSAQEHLNTADTVVSVDVESRYLFGNPAANLDCNLSFIITPYEKSFDRYKGFSFSHDCIDFEPIEIPTRELKLDENGRLHCDWKLPKLGRTPSALVANVDVKVLEKGGRPVPNFLKIPYDPYSYYVGIKGPERRYLRVGSSVPFYLVAVTPDGQPVAGKSLQYRIYHNKRYWWYDYDNRGDFMKRFKSDYATELLDEGQIVSKSEPVVLEYKPERYGNVLIEVRDGEDGHAAGYFFRAYCWGEGVVSKDADMLSIKADAEKYYPGDVAKVIAQTPPEGRALLSVEKGNEVLYSRWVDLSAEETVFDIPITEDMLPTAYAFVSVIQPHDQTTNDRPMRMFGVVPLNVEKEGTRLELEVEAPKVIKPGDYFSITVQTVDRSQAQFT
ncbi:hypothetical protein DRQ36_02140, partial [bacterium]